MAKSVSTSKRTIVLTGPESSGKTTLAVWLSHECHLPLVSEFAREYLENLNRKYLIEDLTEIAKVQSNQIKEAHKHNDLVVADTDLLTIIIWSQEKYGRVDPKLEELYFKANKPYYILCRPDIEWEPDPLRENPHDRERLYGIYLSEIQSRGCSYIEVGGTLNERFRLIKSTLTI